VCVRTHVGVCVAVSVLCNAPDDCIKVSAVSLASSIFNRSLPNLENRLPDKWHTKCTIYSSNGFVQYACMANDFRNNEIFSLVNASGCNFSLIFTKFGTWIAEVIFKAEFICDRKRKYFVCIIIITVDWHMDTDYTWQSCIIWLLYITVNILPSFSIHFSVWRLIQPRPSVHFLSILCFCYIFLHFLYW